MAKKTAAGPPPELVDIVDGQDRPLLVMPLAEAHRQGLFHRSVRVLVYDARGKLYLQKRTADTRRYPGRFDLSATGHVRAGESRHEAAARKLYEELGLRTATLTLLDAAPANEDWGFEFVTLFSAGRTSEPLRPAPGEVAGGVFVDAAELAALTRDYRDWLTPAVVHFFEKNALFPRSR
ncbi:NUDIX hydrolase [Solidesulfovibrio carbinoliphilus subsp. oakridgensis]|uniref:NUDIX hydrolase n=1 Tax=Solidesulfovibrio carbinoliphilus subsp. oakridgensis TaxID=694327 RepID=G7Q674_9BACT|nr:NUDIX domain-containing protein [Solidesulfovibrio carbinoliphilus]EHJ47090.1 NUDIX hydrolase [Solidesulfovibrio carbinoliphilus subsp. oakridgensis]